jgi:hypothetical protein
MSRMSRTILSAVALTALLAAPVHAAPGSRPLTETLWQWVVGMWQDTRLTIDPNGISWTIDPNGLTSVREDTRLTIDPDGIRGTIDPDGSSAGTDGSGDGDIHLTIDPNG